MTDPAERPHHPPYHPAGEDTVVLDAKGLRALAHPVRVQLIGLLRKFGPSTATRLAERLGVNSGTASYHLRQLGAAGFVEEDVERGNARERWWRTVHMRTHLRDGEVVDREPEATLAYLQSVAATYTLRMRNALNEWQTTPRSWRGTFDMSDFPLRLTPAEAIALREELGAVVARYRTDSPETAASAPAGAERVGLITLILPEPEASEPDGPGPEAVGSAPSESASGPDPSNPAAP